ncbi:MAG: hypothetical protein AB1714_22335 [Acidobacteriota bacterium]
MRTPLLVCGSLLVAAALAADTHIRVGCHSDGYYNYGNVVPPADSEVEYWIGGGRLAYITPRLRLVLDGPSGTFLVVDRNDSSCVELPLPLDASKSVSPDVQSYFMQDRAGGTVVETVELRIDGRPCQGYEVRFWIEEQDSRYEDRIETIWTTQDVPFDLETYHLFTRVLHGLYRDVTHWDAALVDQLNSVRGFPVLREGKYFMKGVPRNATRRLVEMTDEDPPPRVYSVPMEIEREALLTLKHVNPFPYHGEWGILE